MRRQIAQAANTHMIKIGSSVDCKEWWHEKCSTYEGSQHLYATTAKFSRCVLLNSRPEYSYPTWWDTFHIEAQIQNSRYENQVAGPRILSQGLSRPLSKVKEAHRLE
ncbi:hypothetical protein AVEN_161842-1 [Araneus ventricosus]|uniref:Uncharacterized protein n=1 Tax=Araneus ventricosus TaxID=182803 RepID=A0A4Y2ILT8_ARAVE|nr:hypothetical protein AVEN_161842-1 [Araneus ventricosus]